MDLVRDLVTLGRASRESARIKVRQPISKVLVDGKYEEMISHLVPLIKEELNVKEVVFTNQLHQFMNFQLKPNFKLVGPVLGPKVKVFAKALAGLDAADTAMRLENGETLTLDLDGEAYEINKENVLITITAKEGFNVATENNLFVILDTTLTQELIDEGLARELVSKVQQMRKNNDYEVTDNIRIFLDANEAVSKAVDEFEDYIKTETLAVEIIRTEDDSFEKVNINDHMTGIRLERITEN